MQIKAKGKEYNVEFTFRVARNEKYKDCLNSVINMMSGIFGADGKLKNGSTNLIGAIVDNVAEKPTACAMMLYVGLTGEKEIKSLDDAWDVLIAHIEENPESSLETVYTQLLEQMGNDHFFEWTGLNNTMDRMTVVTDQITQIMKKKK